MNSTNSNTSMGVFAQELTNLIGQPIGVGQIFPSSEGRFYYIQAPLAGAPMLLHHYRGSFFVDINPDDYEKLANGDLEPQEYIRTANWQVGYYWGGGGMISGGYYQPLDIIGKQETVRRYLRILSCRGRRRSSGYMPAETECQHCFVTGCPLSPYNETLRGLFRAEEIEEYDPRVDFFNSLYLRFQAEHPDYSLRGFFCQSNMAGDSQILLVPNGHFKKEEAFSYTAYASEKVIRDLLMRTVSPSDWGEYAKSFEFVLFQRGSSEYLEVTQENLKAVSASEDYCATKKKNWLMKLWKKILIIF